ncbi:hypothetical protein GFB84_12025 [Acinetobacter baumannii]|nr:hypothetical protein [Acinetobacter baumannii]
MKEILERNTAPDYIDLKYIVGDLYVKCFWNDTSYKLRFPRINSFRVTQEGQTLKMQSEMAGYSLYFLSLEDKLDLYHWLNAQNYGYIDGLNLYKYFLLSSCEVVEIVCGEPCEEVS